MSRKLALLVATYRYQDAGLRQLTAPGHDAEALAEVLRDPDIAGFEVTILVNEPYHVVGRAIADFYRNRRRDDLTFLYFTGHGVKDDDGRLYLAMTDTQPDSLLFTALSAQQIDDAMKSCSSRQKVLVLDCCYSGAFPTGRISKADAEVHTLERFASKGRVVLTASDATQYSFEGNEISGQGTQSVFTRFLVEGLTSGNADLDGDGDICLDELYSYVHDRVIKEMPQQRPKKQEDVEGRIVIAQNIYWSLPAYLRNAIESPIARDRLAALDGLAHLYRTGNLFVREAVINEVRCLLDDDSRAVSAAAAEFVRTRSLGEATKKAGNAARSEFEEQASPAAPPGEMIFAGSRRQSDDSAEVRTRNAQQARREPGWISFIGRVVLTRRLYPWLAGLVVLLIVMGTVWWSGGGADKTQICANIEQEIEQEIGQQVVNLTETLSQYPSDDLQEQETLELANVIRDSATRIRDSATRIRDEGKIVGGAVQQASDEVATALTQMATALTQLATAATQVVDVVPDGSAQEIDNVKAALDEGAAAFDEGKAAFDEALPKLTDACA